MTEYMDGKGWKKIKNWDMDDPAGLIEFIRPWWEKMGTIRITGKKIIRICMATGGWSGNEDIICAMMDNMFWTLWWQKTERGGAYYFRIDLRKVKAKNGLPASEFLASQGR